MSNNNNNPGCQFYIILTIIFMIIMSFFAVPMLYQTWFEMGPDPYTGENYTFFEKMLFSLWFPLFYMFVAPPAATIMTMLFLMPASDSIERSVSNFLKR